MKSAPDAKLLVHVSTPALVSEKPAGSVPTDVHTCVSPGFASVAMNWKPGAGIPWFCGTAGIDDAAITGATFPEKYVAVTTRSEKSPVKPEATVSVARTVNVIVTDVLPDGTAPVKVVIPVAPFTATVIPDTAAPVLSTAEGVPCSA